MLIKAFLFDLDDTLYDYSSIQEKSLRKVYQVLSEIVNISFEEFIRIYKLSNKEIKRELSGTASCHNRVLYFQRVIEKINKTVESNTVLKLYTAYWDTFLENIILGDGVLETFKQLKEQGIKIAIVSNLTTQIQLRKIDKLGIDNYIDVLVTSEEVGVEKPNSAMFLTALNKLNILSWGAIMVGDDPVSDIEGGNAVGLRTVLIGDKYIEDYAKDDYRKPNYSIKKISEILDLLK